jgi:uncharacterized protein (DUF983 family)
MWDAIGTEALHLSHDLPCPHCGHGAHSFLPCSDTCDCARSDMPGTQRSGDGLAA